MRTRLRLTPICVAGFAMLSYSALAGSITYDFDTDPAGSGLQIAQYAAADLTVYSNATPWRSTGGSPATGGFLVINYPDDYTGATILFPDLDQGKLVTAFKLEFDIRAGNGTEHAADGFSISFARSTDPVLQYWATQPGRGFAGDTMSGFDSSHLNPGGFAGEDAQMLETGTSTGIALSFDCWSGNHLPDTEDMEGLIVRVDNKTVLKHALPTRNGACADATSIQTGPRTAAFWTAVAGDANQGIDPHPELVYSADAWTNLCWQHMSVEMDSQGRLTVIWKGNTVLDKYQTTYFPTPGQLVLAGRCGGSYESVHVDNISLTTTAVPGETQPPTVPGNLRADELGSRRIALRWDPSVEQPDATQRVAYDLEKDGVAVPSLTITNYWEDRTTLKPGSTHTYRVRAYDVLNNKSAWASLTVTNPPEVAVPGWLSGSIYDNIEGTGLMEFYLNPAYPNSPSRDGFYLRGLSYNQPSGDWGANYGFRFAGTITPQESGAYRFFVRSDDSSGFYLNPTGSAIPDAVTSNPIAQETACCNPFREPGVANADGTTYSTSDPINLTAGTSYGFVWLVKEGGGGDFGQVAWRKEGDTTPASQLRPIPGIYITSPAAVSDAVGASVTITNQPANVTTVANERVELSVGAQLVSPWDLNAVYQWYKDSKPVLKGDLTPYVIPVAAESDSGKYKVLVTVPGAQATSSEVTVTVGADNKPPTVKSVTQVDDTFTQVTLNFSEPVTDPSATTVGNYTLSDGGTVSAAALSADKFSVTLTTSKLTEDKDYTLTVNNVKDNAGNMIAASTQAKLTTWTMVASRVKVQKYNSKDGDLNGTAIADLINNARFPNSPDSSFYLDTGLMVGSASSTSGWNDSYGDYYGMRITGYLKPDATGQYNFFIRSDDSSALYLNTSGSSTFPNPATDTAVCQETGCCATFQEPSTSDESTSAAISLTAGKSYPFVVLLKEGSGGDGVAVGMRKVGDTTPAAADVPALSSQVYYYGSKAAPITSITIDGIKVVDGKVVITWTGGGTLQTCPSLSSPTWTPVTGAASGQPIDPPASGTAFYRVVSP